MGKRQFFQIQGKNRNCNIWLYPESNLNLKTLNPKPFDIIICDGPYGILKPECEWDDFDLDTRLGRERFRQYYRILFNISMPLLKNSGSLFIFNYPEGASIIKGVLDEEYSVCFRRWLSWIYENHFDFDGNANFQRSHESILYYTKESNGFIFKREDIPDVISHPIIKIESSSFKDGAKPIEIIRYLLKNTACPGSRLLSLFAGSGTDLVAAAEYDMDAVGFECDISNFKLLEKRIKKNSRQYKIFIEPKSKRREHQHEK